MQFKKKERKSSPEINPSSMADIAFLLLIFFLVTTSLVNEKVVNLVLPKKKDENVVIKPLDARNVMQVMVNSSDKLLVNGNEMALTELRENAMQFLTNEGKNAQLSVSPQEAVIAYRTDRGTSYSMFILVLDELKAAYHQVRADKLGISLRAYLLLDDTKPEQEHKLLQASEWYPMQLSVAEPTEFVN